MAGFAVALCATSFGLTLADIIYKAYTRLLKRLVYRGIWNIFDRDGDVIDPFVSRRHALFKLLVACYFVYRIWV